MQYACTPSTPSLCVCYKVTRKLGTQTQAGTHHCELATSRTHHDSMLLTKRRRESATGVSEPQLPPSVFLRHSPL